MAASGSTTVIYIAMGANIGIACAKFLASAWTGSSAMLSEAIHSLVDSSNQVLLLVGITRAQKKADAKHPFGYSKELYFWSFIVAIMLFSLGAGVSIYEGIDKFYHPHPIKYPEIIYIVLGIAIGMEGFSTYKALAEFRKTHTNKKFVTALQKSKDPALFAIVLEDIAAMVGLFTALIGVLVADKLGYLPADAIASIAIGMVLASVAVFMAIEIKSLIIGEAADPEVQRGLFDIISNESGDHGPILAINEIRSMHLGPTDILVAASVDFRDGISAEDVEATTHRIERAIKEKYPAVRQLFIEVQSIASHASSVKSGAVGKTTTESRAPDEASAMAPSNLKDVKQNTTKQENIVARSGKKQSSLELAGEGAKAGSSTVEPKRKATAGKVERATDLAELPSNRKKRKSRRKAKRRGGKKI